MATPSKARPEDIEEWIAAYKSGVDAVQIAKSYDVHHSTVYYQLKKMGVPRRLYGVNAGSSHYSWKGQKASPNSIHRWVKKYLPKPEKCVSCMAVPQRDLANISSTYNPDTYTRDIHNWEWLCRKCHMTKDGRLDRLNGEKRSK